MSKIHILTSFNLIRKKKFSTSVFFEILTSRIAISIWEMVGSFSYIWLKVEEGCWSMYWHVKYSQCSNRMSRNGNVVERIKNWDKDVFNFLVFFLPCLEQFCLKTPLFAAKSIALVYRCYRPFSGEFVNLSSKKNIFTIA